MRNYVERQKTKDERRNMNQQVTSVLVSFIGCLLLMFLQTTARAQSIESSPRVQKIDHSFDNLTIQSYAAQAHLKVEELMEYLQLAADKSNSPALNAQLKANIEQLFSGEGVRLTGIESQLILSGPSQWLDDWKSADIRVESLKLTASELKDTYWIYTYQLTYQAGGRQKTKKMEVQVYLQPDIKAFGRAEKQVWELKIGNITVK